MKNFAFPLFCLTFPMIVCACAGSVRSCSEAPTLAEDAAKPDGEADHEAANISNSNIRAESSTRVEAWPPRYILQLGNYGASDEDWRIGAIDDDGQIIVHFESTTKRFLTEYNEGRFVFYDAGKRYGLLDANGIVVVEPRDAVFGRPSEGLIAVQTESGCGYINLDGNEVIPIQPWDSCSAFKDGKAIVTNAGEPFVTREEDSQYGEGYIDRHGKVIIDLTYKYASDFSEGRAAVSRGFTESGQDEDDTEFAPANRRANYGYIDHGGNPITPFEFDRAEPFQAGMALVARDRFREAPYNETFYDYAFIDTQGDMVWPMTFGNADPFNDSGFARVEICDDKLPAKGDTFNCQSGLIRKDGSWLFKPGRFQRVGVFSEGRVPVTFLNGSTGYVDEKGNTVFAADGGAFVHGAVIVSGNCPDEPDSIRAVDIHGQSIFPFSVKTASCDCIGHEFDAHGILIIETDSDIKDYRSMVLHRERGVVWPPGWNEKGAGEGMLCWDDTEI
ncbi:MAG: WG repeat-containing protein [Proteobacteria bacterium]|nr:WG repeat-containing protein [Pseudomonadota bacterium]